MCLCHPNKTLRNRRNSLPALGIVEGIWTWGTDKGLNPHSTEGFAFLVHQMERINTSLEDLYEKVHLTKPHILKVVSCLLSFNSTMGKKLSVLNKIRFKSKLIVTPTFIHNKNILQLKVAFVGQAMKSSKEKGK